MLDAFRIADDTLRQGIQGVTDLITIPGLINLDFADIRTVMKDAGTAMMGIGLSSGENRALDAAQQATNSALLEASIAGASRVLFSISGGPDLTLTEVDEAARTVEACADENANIIYGQIIDESMRRQRAHHRHRHRLQGQCAPAVRHGLQPQGPVRLHGRSRAGTSAPAVHVFHAHQHARPLR